MKKISTNEARHTLPIVGQGETTDLGVRIYIVLTLGTLTTMATVATMMCPTRTGFVQIPFKLNLYD